MHTLAIMPQNSITPHLGIEQQSASKTRRWHPQPNPPPHGSFNLMEEQKRIELEAATFRKLVKHLQDHPDTQNIDLMILAGFCRNCLAKWYSAVAANHGLAIDYPQAQEIIYGMPYPDWKERFQAEATPEQLEAFKARQQREQSAQ